MEIWDVLKMIESGGKKSKRERERATKLSEKPVVVQTDTRFYRLGSTRFQMVVSFPNLVQQQSTNVPHG